MRQAAIYVRVSQDRTGDSTSPREQADACLAEAERRGLDATVYEDRDVPASKDKAHGGKPRPAYERLLADARAGQVQAILCWSTDRLFRNGRDLEDLIDLAEGSGVEFVALRGGLVDLSTPSGRVQARIAAAINKAEVENLSELVRRKAKSNAEAGLPHGGRRAFGYEADRVTIRQVEAEMVREAARSLLNGGTLATVVDRWNASGILTPSGNRWRTPVIRNILLSPRIAGLRQHRDDTYPAVWQGILGQRTWKALERILRAPERQKFTPHTGRYLLTGLLVCGNCGQRLSGQPKRRKPGYACRGAAPYLGCDRVSIRAWRLEEHISRLAAETRLVDEHPVVGPNPSEREQELSGELDVIEATLAEIAIRWHDRFLDDIGYKALQEPLLARKRATEDEYAKLDLQPQSSWMHLADPLPPLVQEWVAADDSEREVAWTAMLADPAIRAGQRSMIEQAVERIVVLQAGKGGRWHDVSARIDIAWKPGVERD